MATCKVFLAFRANGVWFEAKLVPQDFQEIIHFIGLKVVGRHAYPFQIL